MRNKGTVESFESAFYRSLPPSCILKRLIVHPLSSTRWRIFWDKYRRHRPFHSVSFRQRILAFPSIFIREPFYALERLIYGRRLAEQEIENSPIFIIGHWRSGTTHLHNLLTQDPQFAYLSFSNMTMPFDMLLGKYLPVIPFLMKLALPRTRGIDQLPMKPHLPQEEELALGMLKGVSYYNCYFFPQHWDEYYAESILLGDAAADQPNRRKLKSAYQSLVRKMTLLNRGKQLIFKNPASTGRVAMLKELFPNAKFVHIRRNPYEVFASSLARLPRMLDGFSWQDEQGLDHERVVLDSYCLLMKQYFDQRSEIPEEDLFETSYEELVANPEQVLGAIYSQFGVKRSKETIDRHNDYLAAQKSYQRNRHQLSASQIESIQREWAFALDQWDYDLPSDQEDAS